MDVCFAAVNDFSLVVSVGHGTHLLWVIVTPMDVKFGLSLHLHNGAVIIPSFSENIVVDAVPTYDTGCGIIGHISVPKCAHNCVLCKSDTELIRNV